MFRKFTHKSKKVFAFSPKRQSSAGFTLLELIVVLGLMVVIMGMVLASYAGTRPARNLRIAQNELVSNIRKTQSYALSSRNLPGGQPAQYYVIKFNTQQPTKYTIQGVYNVKTPPLNLRDVETVNLPPGIRISSISIGAATNVSCALVAFQLPFGKILSSNGCTGTPPTLTSTDDYYKVTQYVGNNGGTVWGDVATTITLSDAGGSLTKQVTVNGITGLVNFQ